MQKVTSVDHALEVLGLNIDFENFRTIGLSVAHVDPLVAEYKIRLVIEANNKLNNWAADWANRNQLKYNVYKEISEDASKPSGFGFSDSLYGCWDTRTFVCSRLHVGTREEALYIGKDFEDLFEIAWLIIPETAA